MSTSPDPSNQIPPTDNDVIKIGIIRLPRDQVFPVILIFVLLVAGVGMVTVAADTTRLIGLVIIVVGLGWAALIYQNIQNKRKYDVKGATRSYTLTIRVLSPDKHPVRGAEVTVLGPVPFTNRKTNKDGQVKYDYTGQNADTYRNRDISITVTSEDGKVAKSYPLMPQEGQFLDITLEKPTSVPTHPPGNLTTIAAGDPLAMSSAIQGITREQFNEIIDLLTPFMSTTGQRQALIQRAFFGSKVVNQVDWSGSASQFTTNLVSQLVIHGEYESGKQAVAVLMETLKEDVGVDKQQRIDVLLRTLQA